jgi:hypothetical protein
MKDETNRLCFCDCEGFVVDDNYYDHVKGIFGWCAKRNIPITTIETYRDKCKFYKFEDIPENETRDEKENRWGPKIERWLEVNRKYGDWFKTNFRSNSPHGLIERIFYKVPKYDNVCPSCYGTGMHGCCHIHMKCNTCKGYGGYNDS